MNKLIELLYCCKITQRNLFQIIMKNLYPLENEMPTESGGSINKGLWFVFHHEGNVIRAWGSSASGKERIYLNDSEVADGRSMRKSSSYTFIGTDGTEYRVEFNSVWFPVKIYCSLYVNGDEKEEILAKYYVAWKNEILRILLFMTVIVISSTTIMIYSQSVLTLILVNMAIVFFFLKFGSKKVLNFTRVG